MKLDRFLISPNATIAESVEQLNTRSTQILLVVDSEKRLLGTVTDGDIRRAMLRKVEQSSTLSEIMQKAPLTARSDWSPQRAQSFMRARRIHQIPTVDDNGYVTGVFTEESFISQEQLPNVAVLMVGGLGKRLGALTENCPKPMLKIGGRPILETTIETLRDAGIRRFVLAVNYLSEQIETHFGDGANQGVSISYFHETQPLGTAGALRHIETLNESPLLVMNGDILTRVNYGHLLRYHHEGEACATMCVREFNQQIPFGVVELDGHKITGIREKPSSSFFVNSGIYVLNPESLHYLPASGPFDMPNLFDLLREQQKTTLAYPISEYWADIGQPHDFVQAENDYASNFEAISSPS
jgi:dTDP-glucose pyrophosphorylase/predicted transcriptional regulator